jgi:hypothetical protein
MAKRTSELVVRVEVDYEKLAEAIRKALRESVTITTPGVMDARHCTPVSPCESYTDDRDFTVSPEARA